MNPKKILGLPLRAKSPFTDINSALSSPIFVTGNEWQIWFNGSEEAVARRHYPLRV